MCEGRESKTVACPERERRGEKVVDQLLCDHSNKIYKDAKELVTIMECGSKLQTSKFQFVKPTADLS